jgi:hypothetical protein
MDNTGKSDKWRDLTIETTPSPQRRAMKQRSFRFSNQTPPRAGPEADVENEPSQHTLSVDSHNRRVVLSNTPSPVNVPLPLSVAPKKKEQKLFPLPSIYHDQYGWTPFDTAEFADVFQRNEYANVQDILLCSGGFAKYWRIVSLQEDEAPSADTRALNEEELSQLRHDCAAMHNARPSDLSYPPNPYDPDSMSKIYSPFPHCDVNTFAPLSRTTCKYNAGMGTRCAESSGDSSYYPCSDPSCSLCHSRSGSQDLSQASAVEASSDEDSEGHAARDMANSAYKPMTPEKVHAVGQSACVDGSQEKTPRRGDFAPQPLWLPIRDKKSVLSHISEYTSDDEAHIRGIL